MPDLRRPSLRLSVGLAVVVVGLVEIQGLIQTLEGQARLRERLSRVLRQQAAAARPALLEALGRGGGEGFEQVIRRAVETGLAAEVEVLGSEGRALATGGAGPAPSRHWPQASELRALARGEVVSAGPFYTPSPRVLVYLGLGPGEPPLLLRLSVAVPELVDDLRARRAALVGHTLALALLALAVALLLSPRLAARDSEARSLGAYEQAMERLRDIGREDSAKHAAERRRLEESVRDAQALARAGELAAGIVHELRNGLGTVVGYARLIERGAPPAEAEDHARLIREECETLEGVVRRFMDFVRLDELRLAELDLRRLLARVLSREVRARRVGEASLAPGDPLLVRGDEEMLERAFENVVRNALEAAGPGGRVEIEVASRPPDALVTITDDGPGPAADAPASPRPFYSTKPGGLGLGLPMAAKIVSLHGGAVELVRRPEGGARASLRLPLDGPGSGGNATKGSA